MLGRYLRNVVPRCSVRRSRAPTPLITPRFLFPCQRFCPLKSQTPSQIPASIHLAKYPTRGDRLQRHTAASIYNRRLLLSKPSPDQDAISRARIIKPSLSRYCGRRRRRSKKKQRLQSLGDSNRRGALARQKARESIRGALLKAAVRVHKQHWAARRDALMTRILNNDNDPVNGISFSPSIEPTHSTNDRADGFEPRDSNRESISNSNPGGGGILSWLIEPNAFDACREMIDFLSLRPESSSCFLSPFIA